MADIIIYVLVAIIVLFLLTAAIKVVYQYEAGVVFRLGRLESTRKPGLRLIIPFIDRMRKVDTRVLTMDVPSQEAITRDNVTLKVNAVVYFRVLHPEAAVIEVYDYKMATYQIAQTTLRSVLGQSELDELLAHRDKINQQLQQIIDDQTEPWGIKVSVVEVKDVELPASMQRAMAAQAEAERERRAKIIHAEGELQASEKLAQAGRIIGAEPTTLQLRYLQTLTEIATEKTQTVVFPLPLDMISAFMPDKKK
ncbi:MAG: slipin family protein [Chloroflexota bacterium]|nr:slipin family protein [Chloroflexota bacterium]